MKFYTRCLFILSFAAFLTSCDNVIKPEFQDTAEAPEIQTQSQIPEAASEFNGHHYLLIKKRMNWTDARNHCENLGGYLATISTEKERAFLQNLVKNQSANRHSCAWLGATDQHQEFQWQWINSEPFVGLDKLEIQGGKSENYLNFRLASGKLEDYGLDGEKTGDQWILCEWD